MRQYVSQIDFVALLFSEGAVPGAVTSITCAYCERVGTVDWWARQDGSPSAYARLTGLEVDHIEPISRGGGHHWTNLVLACRPCNRRKGNRIWFPFVNGVNA